jgi:hypothetical protein
LIFARGSTETGNLVSSCQSLKPTYHLLIYPGQ